MIDDANFFKKRTLIELENYIDEVRKFASSSKAESDAMQLRKGNYKKFREELYPLFEYGLAKYGRHTTHSFRLIEGNQSYDAEISNGTEVVETLELTFPIDGNAEVATARALVESGVSFGAINDFTHQKFLKALFSTIEKKASKDYNGKSLIIVVDNLAEFSPADEYDRRELQTIVQKLRTISFLAESVSVMTLSRVINGTMYAAEIFKIK